MNLSNIREETKKEEEETKKEEEENDAYRK